MCPSATGPSPGTDAIDVIGRKLGHYRILDRLATGGMGVVWLAEDESLKRRVALKTLRDDLAASPERLARFEREAKAIAALNHPNIVTIHSIEEADGVRFLAMEYVEGKPLDEVIPAGGLPLPEFLRIAIPIADALAAAHARGITHRDLKPANVVVGDGGPVKILDFGLAKLQIADATAIYGHELQSTLTREGTVVGTLHYMSPEQLQLKQIDHRTDLFSLGIVLYEMATGDLPFRGESAAQVISSVLRDAPRRLDDLDQRLPPEIADIVAGCLEKEVGKRTSSAALVRDRLTTVAHQIETGAASAASTRLRHLAQRVRRRTNPWLVAGVVALVAGLASATWWISDRSSSSPATASAAVIAEPPTIAVLPLADYSDDPEYFVDGMTDGLIGSLARLGGIRVISRQSAMHYKGSDKRLPEIAAELGADYIVEASITRDGGRLRLQAQVVQPDPEQQIWADVFDRAATDVLALHNSVATAIADAVHVRLTPTEEGRMASTKAVDPEVYEAYLQGKHWAGKFSEDDLRKAKAYFERAIALDPGFAPAWTGLAETIGWLGRFHIETEPAMAQAEAAALRALQIDPQDSDAHAALANIALARWQWKDAEVAIRRAIEHNSNSARAHQTYWRLLAPLKRFEEARREVELAAKLEPLSAQIRFNLGVQSVLEGRLNLAESELKSALELDPDFTLTHAFLWVLYAKLGKDPDRGVELGEYIGAMGFPEALPQFRRDLESGDYRSALHEVALRLSERLSGDPAQVGFVAGLLAEASEKREALRWLRFGLEKKVWDLPWSAVSPDLDSLHGDPEFEEILSELGLPASSN